MAKKTVKLGGLDKVMKNLKAEVGKIEGRTMSGLIKSSILIRRDMDQTSPKVPVDSRNLQSSFFTVTSRGDTPEAGEGLKNPSEHARKVQAAKMAAAGQGKELVIMGFSANYAIWVHEMTDANKFQRPGAGPKFFERAIDRNKGKVLQIIANETKIQ